MEIAASSTEFVRITAVAKVAGATITLIVPPRFAFLATAANPVESDWLTGEWAAPQARILVGPAAGAVTLAVGRYSMWITFTAGTETPVYRSGTITVY